LTERGRSSSLARPAGLSRLAAIVVTFSAAAVLLGLIVVAGRLWMGVPRLHGPETLEPAVHRYSLEGAACALGAPVDVAPGPEEEATAHGFRFSVRVPANYDATKAHPLIVVFAPREVNRYLLERLAGLTRAATAAGFVVAYADSVPLSVDAITELATIPERIAGHWCIDEERIYLTGHSDGGTVATAIAFRRLGTLPPAAIAPSAAGVRRKDLEAESCPPPLSVRILHGAHDRLFPGFGAEAAAWWAKCNRCDVAAPIRRADRCLEYPTCTAGVTTLYCEHDGRHADWNDRPESLIDFFRSSVRAR
jgi:polyhydroxybutyrate depolymerase